MQQARTNRTGEEWGFYAEVPQLLHDIKSSGIKLAVASRTHTPKLARQMLQLLSIESPAAPASTNEGRNGESSNYAPKRIPAIEAFDDLQIFPDNKVKHMFNIRKALGVGYSDMLFFDDEMRNKNVERELGVAFHCVDNGGMSMQAFDDGIDAWRRRRKV